MSNLVRTTDREAINTIHQWLNRNYPRAGRCTRCGRTDRKTEYACAGHRYTRDIQNYVELCRPCHAVFDGRTGVKRPEVSELLKGRTFSAETLAKMSAAKKGKKNSASHVANMSKARKGVPWTPARRAAQERKKG